MMFGWLLKRLFMDKNARAATDRARRLRAAQQESDSLEDEDVDDKIDDASPDDASADTGSQTDAAEGGSEREKLIRETMALYRQKRAEYENLDDSVRDRIEAAARDALGRRDEG